MSKNFSTPRGTNDLLPQEISIWQSVESKTRQTLSLYGFSEIRTPIYEETGLFKRSLGQTSDVVNKQLLELKTEKDEGLALRPEGTASVVRAYIEHGLSSQEGLSKLFYIGPMFRGERPQKGRLRQFHQIGVEAIGPNSSSPYLDAEVIILSMDLLKALGVDTSKARLKINSLGTPEDKENFSKVLRAALQDKVSKLCEDCQSRFDRNVFRILDCKNEQCQKIVDSYSFNDDFMSEESRQYYRTVRQVLDDSNIKYEHTPKLVRGLDYYMHTVFEISHSGLGSQDAIGAGGRYNNLVQQLGGAQADAVGFALGIERILLTLAEDQKVSEAPLDYFIAAFNEEALKKAFQIARHIREANRSCETVYKTSSPKSQMRAADKSGARRVIILGEDEIKGNFVTLKDMQTGEQTKEPVKDFLAKVSK